MTASSPDSIAIRLADEGVPLRAIARAIHTSSDLLRERLQSAREDGLLVDLPKEDWPPGFPRDQRALQLSRMVVEDRDAVMLTLQAVFHLTATEATLLMTLLQHDSVPRERLDMARKTIDVHICNIRRRLAAFSVDIATLWGYGYQLAPASRKKVVELLLARTKTAEAAA